jgi:predicted  nucleic acid-binding Zn-ribbon protein
MAAPRTAEQIHWSDANAKRPDAHWGCWDCGHEESYVKDVDKDADHVRVRRRQCTRCGAWWETEERRIARGSFFGRAERRRMASFRKKRYTARNCLMCHEKYMSGKYVQHTQTSTAHLEAAARKAERVKERERRYQRRWMAAKRAVERSQRRAA